MKIIQILILLAFTISLPVAGAEPSIDAFFGRFCDEWMRGDPSGATLLQYFKGAEQDALDRQLTPITKEFRAERIVLAKRGLKDLKAFDRATLTRDQRISAASLEWQLDNIVRGEAFEDHHFVFNQFAGLQVSLVNGLSQFHPVRNRRDIENYLARLKQVAGQMDEGVAQAKDRAQRNFLPPKFILQATLSQFDRFLSDEPSRNVLVASLNERATALKDVSVEQRAALVAEAEKIVSESVIPSFRRAKALLEMQLPQATEEAGVSSMPDGVRAYAQSLRHLTTTDLTFQEIHELGLKEVKRIEVEIDLLLKPLGYKSGSIKERLEKLNASLQPAADPDPRPALLAEYERMLRDAEKRCELIFEIRPKAGVEVRREPIFTEKSAAPHYVVPAKDGSRPGVFWVPLPGPDFDIIGMRTLAYHEAVPGHHFQVALQNEKTNTPPFRRDRIFGTISAHGEGWALYAEQLAAENGWYQDDPKGHLGQLAGELWRARRLVVDTGLHAKHWTRQQAIDYGISPTEVDRYVAWPGQACSYKIGQLKILELREKAKKALGEKFSIKQFHNVILQAGALPLSVLEQVVDDYIQSAK